MTLEAFFKENKRVALAFSGGTDSAYLLYSASRFAERVTAYYVKTVFQPLFELNDAQRLAEELGAQMKVIELDVLSDKTVAENPADRCYHCKKQIFSAIYEKALEDGFDLIIDGTNASDDEGDRPGMKALREIGVRSPLRECGLSKEEIREKSKEAGLFTWNKPAYACLATRIPSGTAITKEMLTNTEKAENFLFALGFEDFRVRWFHGAAKIQIKGEQVTLMEKNRDNIYNELKKYYSDVLADMRFR